jgi:hypothetical protein
MWLHLVAKHFNFLNLFLWLYIGRIPYSHDDFSNSNMNNLERFHSFSLSIQAFLLNMEP